uniref:Prefoldin subunit 4 n=1 Tax=Oryctolagus cuniculus TaxID=9986 RepID=A0A5F9C3G8_RABIT
MSSSKMAAAGDVTVTFEDQQKINKFARNKSRLTEPKEEVEVKKKRLQHLEDACDDIMLAEDDCSMIPYQMADEIFEEAKKNLQEEIDALESRMESVQQVLAHWKVQLYAKFGSNINLGADES